MTLVGAFQVRWRERPELVVRGLTVIPAIATGESVLAAGTAAEIRAEVATAPTRTFSGVVMPLTVSAGLPVTAATANV